MPFYNEKGMSKNISVSLFDLVLSVSNVIDLLSTDLKAHHARVACASLAIAQEMRLGPEDTNDLVLAALLHDIGIISDDERAKVLALDSTHIDAHANKGWMLLRGFRYLSEVAEIVRHHHESWSECVAALDVGAMSVKSQVSLSSHILHLADRVNILIGDPSPEVLDRIDTIVASIEQESGGLFAPHVVDAFKRLSTRDSFWMDLVSPQLSHKLLASVSDQDVDLIGDDLHDFSQLMAKIIDFRCSFTAMHSSSVAHVSAALASLNGLPLDECKKIKLAGYLHDIGKLAIPREILEKNGKLTVSEYSQMRTHVYYTRYVLEHICGFEDIVTWASQHHERLDGSGYPDGCNGEKIPLGSRIVAVADVFAALSEVRPYRTRQTRQEVTASMMALANKMVLDSEVVSTLVDNLDDMEIQLLHARDDVAAAYGEYAADSTIPIQAAKLEIDNMVPYFP